jgi:hypothetical protein
VIEYSCLEFMCRRLSFLVCRSCRLWSPLIRATKASGTGWGRPLGVVASPTVEELLAQMECQPPAPQGGTEPATATAEEVVAAEVQEEVPAEAGLVDIASILGAPTVTVVRSSL